MASEKRRQRHIQKFFEAKEKGLEHQKLKKRAAELRRAEEKKSGSQRRKVRRGDWEDLIEGDAKAFVPSKARSSSTSKWLARLEAEQAALEAHASQPLGTHAEVPPEVLAEGLVPGTVVFVTAGACRVELDAGTEVDCTLDADLRRAQRTALAVGDRVLVEPGSEAAGTHLRHVLPRRSQLSRPDPHDARIERVIAANVDVVVVVAAAREPKLSVGLVERVVLAAQRGGATPIVAVTKLDLCEAAGVTVEEALAPLAPLRASDVEVFACSAKTGAGIDALRARIAGGLCALVGHSGVGKSSLVNALDPALELLEGRVRTVDGKGRHTTTASSLHRLAGNTRLIDTPGVRQFGLGQPTAAELAATFPEIAEAAEACHFRDCSHLHEPRCGVRAALEVGAIAEARMRSYLRIRDAT